MSTDEFVVTPWHVEGDIDYDKLIKRFGTQKISLELLEKIKNLAKEDHFMLRRGIFFSHRDMNRILEDYEKGKDFFLYTGRGPSGHTHIGHLVPWVFAKWLQEKFDVNLYFQLTDDEKFYSKPNLTLEETNKFAYENALDFIALGFNPKKTKIIINTKNIQTLYPIAAQVAKKINFSNTKATFGFTNETNIGMIFYTSLQSAPCFIENKPVLIPLGVDQDPHFRLTRDIAQKIGKQKPALIHNIMIPALTGAGGKMSSSEDKGTIYTTDTPDVVKKKINKFAFSGGQPDIQQHRKLGGNPDIDVSYQYLRIFFEPDDDKLKKIYEDYKSGKLLSGELKLILIEKINEFLKVHQAKREKAKQQIDQFLLKDK
ncbi:MAG: tryptophan--tRNA ligase [Crenarchaeota archaeon]|nr:tryptophan--tRNA ligase [Thermoproteota archaeon]HJJ21540.1 tryptophan--tRNA ligase [Nitrosopumilus sp.]MDA0853162.1 tryptophan--tRNA ligase [Thermoproteota archaeon]MDA1123674.1 tryptophan--tRNA ligase [Thermoproteota archaeon]HJJ23803.1 tryptophan--tRNA ligase [Nitrosopumilus sp.]